MKTNSGSRNEDELAKKFEELIKPLYKANETIMHSLVNNLEIKAIVQEARESLKIPKNGRKPNTPKTYQELLQKHNYKLPILFYTTSLEERSGELHSYVEKIMSSFDVYENFRVSFEIYIVHNVIVVPSHNVALNFKIHGDGRSHLPDVHFYRAPYGNDWEIAKLLMERHINSLPEKFKKSYRGKKNLNEHLKIQREASDRKRTSIDETYNITDAEIADVIYHDPNKSSTVKKVLSRNRKRSKELTSRPRWTLHRK